MTSNIVDHLINVPNNMIHYVRCHEKIPIYSNFGSKSNSQSAEIPNDYETTGLVTPHKRAFLRSDEADLRTVSDPSLVVVVVPVVVVVVVVLVVVVVYRFFQNNLLIL